MAFLGGIFKKKEKDPLAELNDLNLGNDSSMQGQDSMQPTFDPITGQPMGQYNQGNDMDSGGVDSFGNPRVSSRVENTNFNTNPMTNQMQQQPQQDIGRDFELILAKLDTLRAEVSNLNQRIELMERNRQQSNEQPQQQNQRYRW